MNSRPGDELIGGCWKLMANGRPYQALARAEQAMRAYRPAMDSLLAGRLCLVIGLCLEALGRRRAARHYLCDASWALESARDAETRPGSDPGGRALRVETDG